MTSLIIVLTLLVGIMIYSQISSNKEAVRNREYEKEREIRKQETEKKIFEILEKSKRYFESNKFNECIVELDKLNEFNATDRAKNLRIQCQLGLKEFVKVSNISPPYTDEMLYFKVIALLEIKNYDQAMELIPLGFKRKNHEKFIVLFHQYINPLNDFNLFWRYLDRNSKAMLASRMEYGKINIKGPIKKGQVIRRYDINEAKLIDFMKLVELEEIDLSCISGEGSYRSPININGEELSNLGILKYFEKLKVLNLRGQKKISSAWGLNYLQNLTMLNLSDIPHEQKSIILKQLQNKVGVKIYDNDSDFIKDKIELKPFWIEYRKLEIYHEYFKSTFSTQDYPQIFVPKCYFENFSSYKSVIHPTIPIRNTTNQNTKGKSEKQFELALKSEFGNNILVNQALQLHVDYNPLLPDFVFQNDKILIDIEIDEPYIYLNKAPTHFVGYDEDRNYQFCNKDWFVIR